MRIFRLVLSCVVLAGCSSGTVASPPLPAANLPNSGALALGAAQRSASSFALQPPAVTEYESLYSFKGGTDGRFPHGGLIAVNGALYGTTSAGGPRGNGNVLGNGTVFKVSTSGTESVLYSFKGFPSDGSGPVAGLIDVNGVLYGTTGLGGASGHGTVFKGSVRPARKARSTASKAGRTAQGRVVRALLT